MEPKTVDGKRRFKIGIIYSERVKDPKELHTWNKCDCELMGNKGQILKGAVINADMFQELFRSGRLGIRVGFGSSNSVSSISGLEI